MEVKEFVAGLGKDVETSVRVSAIIEQCVKASLAASGQELAWIAFGRLFLAKNWTSLVGLQGVIFTHLIPVNNIK